MGKPRNNPTPDEQRKQYEDHLARTAAKQADKSRQARDIAPIPPVADPARRAHSEESLRAFCDAYFPDRFYLDWSAAHLETIETLEKIICSGGQLSLAMPRGSGKTSLIEVAAVWAAVTGRRRLTMIIGASEDASSNLIDSIRDELEGNDLLHADFPEVCYPIRRLEGIATRAPGQHLDGDRTQITLAAKEIVLPTIEGSAASGAMLVARGITGSIRGFKKGTQRPDLVIIDDPQDDDSAHSLSQTQKREDTINSSVLGLAGPDQKIAACMLCTKIAVDDLSSRYLDRKRYPSWQGKTFALMNAMPSNEKLWQEYIELRDEGLRQDGDASAATQFYLANQQAMDAGASPAWPQRHNADEVSAIQHAMNLKADRGDRAFFSEYQNAPLAAREDSDDLLDADGIVAKATAIRRGFLPVEATHLTAAVDVQKQILFYTVIAWADDFTGWVVDYGAWPRQDAHHFDLNSLKGTLARSKPGANLEAQIYNGLTKLCDELLDCDWQVESSGAEVAFMRVERCLIDANWGESTNTIYQFCRQSEHRSVVMPSHGRGITASMKPMTEYQKRPGEKVGDNWYVPTAGKRGIRHVTYDSNHWKTFVHQRLSTPLGDKGSLALLKGKPIEHRMFAEHLTAEFKTRTQGRGREVDEWKLRVGRENHWLDTTVMSAVAASMVGVRPMVGDPNVDHAPKPQRRRRRRVVATF